MRRALIIYSALIVGMLSVVLGFPFKILPDRKPQDTANAASAAAPVAAVAPATAAKTSSASALAAADQGLAQPVVRGGDASLEQTTSAILTDLAMLPKGATGEADGLQAMSVAALSGLRALRGLDAAGPATLETLVASALREGQTDSYINTLVNEAAGKGEISVPSALVTSDGRVDTAVLLSSLVTRAQEASGQIPAARPQDVVAGGVGVEVRMVTPAIGQAVEHQFYTVTPGDSLGSIAMRFYGDVRYFSAIFNANRALLSSPDKLRVGQRLVVPRAEDLG